MSKSLRCACAATLVSAVAAAERFETHPHKALRADASTGSLPAHQKHLQKKAAHHKKQKHAAQHQGTSRKKKPKGHVEEVVEEGDEEVTEKVEHANEVEKEVEVEHEAAPEPEVYLPETQQKKTKPAGKKTHGKKHPKEGGVRKTEDEQFWEVFDLSYRNEMWLTGGNFTFEGRSFSYDDITNNILSQYKSQGVGLAQFNHQGTPKDALDKLIKLVDAQWSAESKYGDVSIQTHGSWRTKWKCLILFDI